MGHNSDDFKYIWNRDCKPPNWHGLSWEHCEAPNVVVSKLKADAFAGNAFPDGDRAVFYVGPATEPYGADGGKWVTAGWYKSNGARNRPRRQVVCEGICPPSAPPPTPPSPPPNPPCAQLAFTSYNPSKQWNTFDITFGVESLATILDFNSLHGVTTLLTTTSASKTAATTSTLTTMRSRAWNGCSAIP